MAPSRSTTAAPQIDPLHLGELEAGDVEDLSARADLDGVGFVDVTTAELTVRDGVLAEVRFDGLSAEVADLGGARFAEVELARVHLPVVRAARSQWRDVRINGRIGGFEAYDTEWRSVRFNGCKIDYLNLRGAELLDVELTDCVIGELDLLEATARRVRFERTRVAELNLQRAELHDVDLRGAELAVVDGVLDLGGATVTPDQLTLLAPLLAQRLGIQVEPS